MAKVFLFEPCFNAPSIRLKIYVYRAFCRTLGDVKVAYSQMAQWGTWQLHLRQQLPQFVAEFCNIKCFPWVEKKVFFAILNFQDIPGPILALRLL